MKKLLVVFMSTLLFFTSVLSFNAYYYGKTIKTTKINGVDFEYRIIDNKSVEIIKGKCFIPEEIDGLPVTRIGSGAYKMYNDFEFDPEYSGVNKNWKIPDTVTYIGNYAFEYNDSIETITIPSGVVHMGNGAFEECYRLKSVKLPPSLTEIPPSAFEFCFDLEKVELDDAVDLIGEYAFFHCTKLKSINIPAFGTRIGKKAFFNCTSLKKLDFSNSDGSYVKSKGIGFYGELASDCMVLTTETKYEKKIPGFRIICDPGVGGISKYALKNKFNLTFNIKNNNKYFGEIGAGDSVNITIDGKKPSKLTTKRKIVKIDQNGKITGLKKGDTNITATMSDGKKYTGTFRVSDNPTLKMKNKNGKYKEVKTISITKGKTASVKIFGKASSIKNKYTNTKIAKVTSKNTATTLKIKGLKQGTTTLKISVNGVVLKLKVNVK